MRDINTLSKIAALTLVSVAMFATGCEGPAPLATPVARLSSEPAPAAGASYSVIGDCARASDCWRVASIAIWLPWATITRRSSGSAPCSEAARYSGCT